MSSPLASASHSQSAISSVPSSSRASYKEPSRRKTLDGVSGWTDEDGEDEEGRGGPPTALVLQGQSGAGALAVLLLRKMHPHVRVVVQVESSALGMTDTTTKVISLMEWSAVPVEDMGIETKGADVLARLKAWGVEMVCVGSASRVLGELARRTVAAYDDHGEQDDEESASVGLVDYVLDTVGGIPVWNAAAQLLAIPASSSRGEAMFVTLVGDTAKAVPGVQELWRAARGNPPSKPPPPPSLPQHSAGEKKRRKAAKTRKVGYVWVPCVMDVDAEGGDVRDGIREVMRVLGVSDSSGNSGSGGGNAGDPAWVALSDLVGEVEVFERAPQCFGPKLEGGDVVVVKIAAA
jgi:hypothetical protein